MNSVTGSMAEEWFDQNPDAFQEYVLKKADLSLINRWLVNHGFHTLQEYISGRLGYSSNEGSTPSSPIISDSGFFDSKHHRSNSKKHLRQDFARSKMRNIFRTYEPSSSPELGVDARRSSLKEMRQFRSLPPNSVNMLSMLIQSRVRLPRYPSKDIDSKKELRYTNEKEFFLEIVKDISNDLDLKSLSTKIVANMCVLVDSDKASIFLVEGRNTPRPSLVSKIFDVHAGSDMLPSLTGDGSIRMAWGKGVIGQVAETGEIVNLDGNACKNMPPTKNTFRYRPAIDIIMLREYLAQTPCSMVGAKKGEAWTAIVKVVNGYITDTLGEQLQRVTERSSKDRLRTLLDAFKKEEMASLKASGTDEEFDERDQLLTDITSLIEEEDEKKLGDNSKVKEADKRKVEEGLQVRNIAMDSLKDKPNEGPSSAKKKKKTSTSTDYVAYLKEKNEREFALRSEELKLSQKRLDMEMKESEVRRKKDDAILEILIKSLNK